MSLLIANATIIDGVADKPIEGRSILIDGNRIEAIGGQDELGNPSGAQTIDARGKYVIPGLMNANVHLFVATSIERLARHVDHFEDLIAESAQVALKSGLTTVFDTWGPRRHLMSVRDRINAGTVQGSRIFCAGNIIGFDGPISADFPPAAAQSVASSAFAHQINAIWVENVGRHLMWLTPDQVAKEVRTYIGKGIDFVKYASNEHFAQAAGAFLQFTPLVQEVIVNEAHRAGITAQAHCMSVEGLRIAVDAGCDLITHANYTGPTPIPDSTVDEFVRRKTGAVVFPMTQRRLDWFFKGSTQSDSIHTMYLAADTNVRKFIRSGAMLMMANDAGVFPPEIVDDSEFWKMDNFMDLADGHFLWFKAMEEKECAPMEILRAATRNIATAYKLERDLGTLEVGKIADMLILDKNPLDSSENYRALHSVIKDGVVVDRKALPTNPILTKTQNRPVEEESSYKHFLRAGNRVPICPTCMKGYR